MLSITFLPSSAFTCSPDPVTFKILSFLHSKAFQNPPPSTPKTKTLKIIDFSGCVLIQIILFQDLVELTPFGGEGLLPESWREDMQDTWEGLTRQ